MSFYDEWTISKLFDEFFSGLSLDKKIFFTSIGVDEEKLEAITKSFDFAILSDAQIEVIKISLEDFLNKKTYEKYLRDGEDDEYCIHIAHAIIRKCSKELNDRNPELSNERTSK